MDMVLGTLWILTSCIQYQISALAEVLFELLSLLHWIQEVEWQIFQSVPSSSNE